MMVGEQLIQTEQTLRHRVAGLIRDGRSPTRTAAELRITGSDVRHCILLQVAEGGLTRSEVIISIPAVTRQEYERLILSSQDQDYLSVIGHCRSRLGNGSFEEFQLYFEFRNSLRSDTYNLLEQVDTWFRNVVRARLEIAYGKEETGWWKRGIPEEIRMACLKCREADPYQPAEPYSYSTIKQLGEIVNLNWNLFVGVIPLAFANGNRELQNRTAELDAIRDAVLNPAKQLSIQDEDFAVVLSAKNALMI